jgi:alpha-soluble NSF attachment protein
MSNRGDQFFQNAEKKLTSFSLFNKNGKYTDAADLFTKAGNCYKSTRDWAKAGEAYSRAADCQLHVNALTDAAQSATDSGKMFAKSPDSAQKAIEAFRLAVRVYRENSKPTQAARLLVDSAKLFQESGDLDSAIEAYQDAAQLYDDENQPLQAVNQIVIIADIKASQQKWLEAARAYRDVAERRMRDRLTQMAAGEFFTKAALCQMAADDAVGAENMVREFITTNPGWERSREHAMLVDVLKAIDERNPEAFATAVAEYDQIKRLDRWMTDVLLVVKGLLEGQEESLL